ncbi:MAG: histidine kinase [Bacteroidota bacterium]
MSVLFSSQQYRKKLYQIALITTPFFCLLSLIPIVLFLQTLPPAKAEVIDVTALKTILFVSLVVGNFVLQWGVNIWLLKTFENGSIGSSINKDWLRYLFSHLIVFLVFFFPILLSSNYQLLMGDFSFYPLFSNFASNSFILIMINLVVSRNEYARLKLEKAELEISQLITQQEQLKQQIHPHFLFNALGTLQILIKSDAEKAVLYAQRLATFLRVSLTLAQSDIVSIKEEIAFFENYLQLQQMRFEKAINYTINIPDVVLDNGRLPVFSLQLLAENAIKHNAFSSNSPMEIVLIYEPKSFLWISNDRFPKYKHRNGEKSGIGLKNLSKRFGHFTEDLPQIMETEKHFKVKLKVLGI